MIIHFYIKSFCAGLEQLRDTELSGKPVVVTHRTAGGEFVVSASLEAKLHGVREGMTARRAGRHCPDAVFLPTDWKMYRGASQAMLDILAHYSPLVEPHGRDRAYMDVAGCSQFGTPKAVVKEVMGRVKQVLGVRISAGIARNKLTAYAAASICEPGDYIEIAEGDEREFLAPLPISCLPGVGPKIGKRLFTLGISSVGDLASIPESMLARQLGIIGGRLHKLSLGIDHTPVLALHPPEIIITEHTFGEHACEPGQLEEYVLWMVERLSIKVRKRGQKVGRVQLKLEFEDGETADCSYVPKAPVSSMREIYVSVKRMLRIEMPAGIVSIRLTLSDLRSVGGIQLGLVEDSERRARLDLLFENVRSRFGDRSLVYGSDLI